MIGNRSIRVRVLGAMFLVLTLTMLAVGIVTDALFINRQIHDMDTRLREGISHAQGFVARTTQPQELIDELSQREQRVHLKLPDGSLMGEAAPENSRSMTEPLDTTGRLNGTEVTVWESTEPMTGARRSLDRALSLVALLGVAGGTLLTVAITDVALRPLEVMANRANRIAEGERGIRMTPPNETTEVGRTAAAIDEMLDELEGAEIRARAAEAHARASAEQMQGFLSDAAHELKTPMAGIQAAAESLIQLPAGSDEEREQIAFLLAREANRGGHLVNSLLEAAVFGRRIGELVAESTPTSDPWSASHRTEREPRELPRPHPDAAGPFSREALQHAMWQGTGVFRTVEGLEQAKARLGGWLSAASSSWDVTEAPDTLADIEDQNLLTVGHALVTAALSRTESRGAHQRADFPATDPRQAVSTRWVAATAAVPAHERTVHADSLGR